MKELDVVRLIKEFEGMDIGTEGTIVHKYNEHTFEVEYFDDEGDTIDVYTTTDDILELVQSY